MSDNEQPKSPRSPREGRPKNDQPGFNWRVWILLTLGFVTLWVAFGVGNDGEAKKMTLPEFREKWDKGLVITGEKNFPLELISKETGANVMVKGFVKPESAIPELEENAEIRTFVTPLNTGAQADDLRRLLNRGVNYEIEGELPTIDGETLTVPQLRRLIALGDIVTDGESQPAIYATPDGSSVLVTGKYRYRPVETAAVEDKELVAFQVPLNLRIDDAESLSFFRDQATPKIDSDFFENALLSFLPFLLLIFLLFILFRAQMKSAGRGAMSFGKSKARLLTQDKGKVTFKDVAGIQEAKEELTEIVDFLRDPKRFQNLGGTIPKGVLMVGPPGTGKTLLARSVAGEADVPFYSISGSDFVEMFVGVGASRVRDMFEQGRKQAPCLIFIDEIDAVGRHRGHGMGGGHDEREQTLNALLVEMDGFDAQDGVIIIAATNRPDVLDPALLRPGRFDRQVTVGLPDVIGREEILKVHVKKIKLVDGVDLGVIARGTPGFSGAELANLINEAALLAARKRLKAVTLTELEEARDKVRWGKERRSLALSEDDKLKTAYHEAGHAILNVVLENTDPLHKVTIIPRGPALGMAMMLPEKDKFSQHRKEMLDFMVVAMGGRVGEELMLDDVASGASGDIRMATNIARSMVCEWGMSDELGMVDYSSGESGGFLARDMMNTSKNYSEATAQKIDNEIKRFIDEAYAKATKILSENKDKLELIGQALMEYETLSGENIEDLMRDGDMKNPPPSPQPPELPPSGGSEKVEREEVEEVDDDDEGPESVPIGAPA